MTVSEVRRLRPLALLFDHQLLSSATRAHDLIDRADISPPVLENSCCKVRRADHMPYVPNRQFRAHSMSVRFGKFTYFENRCENMPAVK
jgi:hypothetical protein